MTEQEIKDSGAAFEHAVRTKSVENIQVYYLSSSSDCDWVQKDGHWFHSDYLYRIKPKPTEPTPKLRPWNPGEEKVDAWYRKKGQEFWHKPTRRWIYEGEARLGFDECNSFSFTALLNEMEWSADPQSGQWNPCGVEE